MIIDFRDMKKLGFSDQNVLIGQFFTNDVQVKITNLLDASKEFENDIVEIKAITKDANLYYRKHNNPYTSYHTLYTSGCEIANFQRLIFDASYSFICSRSLGGKKVFNWSEEDTDDGFIYRFKRIKRQVVNELINIKYEKFPMTLILSLSARVITKGNKELADPKTNPKINFMAKLMTVKQGGSTQKKTIVLNIKDGKLYWKNAPFTAHNVEFFEEKLKEIL
jgi:hypothetical protein